jgi:hypothetical protein
MDSGLVLPSVAVSVVVAVIGYLLNRSIGSVDKSLSLVHTKVDGLTAADAATAVQITELRVRLAHVEAEILQLQRIR